MNNYIYIAVMALVSYTIRILPLTLIRKPIKNQFMQSFLYYVPYVTLAVMTFPVRDLSVLLFWNFLIKICPFPFSNY